MHQKVLGTLVVVAVANRTLLVWSRRPANAHVPRKWVAVTSSLLVALWWLLVFLYWRLPHRTPHCSPPTRLVIIPVKSTGGNP